MLKGLATDNTPNTLVALARRIKATQDMKRDYVLNTTAIEMQVQEDRTPVLAFNDPGIGGGITTPILPIAHNQIGLFTGIPAKYYDRMAAEAPDLLASNVNRWLRDEPKNRMVRTLGGDTRAFLSDRYQRIENEHIAEVALPVLLGIPEVQIVSCELTERRMYIQAVSPRVQGEVKRGDVVQAGVIISNSEIGFGAVTVKPMVYRLACLNGLIRADEAFRAYHVGRQIEDTADLWKDDTRKADDRAILLKVRDMITAAVDDVKFGQAVDRMKDLADSRVTGDPAKAVEVLGKAVGATEDEQGGILRALIEGGDISAWGLVNAVTAQAHTTGSYDRAVEFEAAGGKLVDLPKTEWKRILEAA